VFDVDGDAPNESTAVGEASAWTASAYVITGPLIYGGLGWLLDRWIGTSFLLPLGILAGMVLSFYVVTVRYRVPHPADRPRPDGADHHDE
jgi:ATP synthase protein I